MISNILRIKVKFGERGIIIFYKGGHGYLLDCWSDIVFFRYNLIHNKKYCEKHITKIVKSYLICG